MDYIFPYKTLYIYYRPISVFRVSIARPRKINQIKSLFGNLAQSSHYQVVFGGLQSELLGYLGIRGVDSRFISEDAGLLCYSASIPGSSFATSDINGNFTGVSEKMAHTRMFQQMSLDFFVDADYKVLKFLEHWIEFIGSGSNVSSSIPEGYFFRMQYPSKYKSYATRLYKFDRNYGSQIEYTFYGLFPVALDPTVVTYQGSEVLKCSATFNYERYISGRVTSYAVNTWQDNNKIPSIINNTAGNTRRVPVSPGAAGAGGVVFRPVNVPTGEAIVSGQIYNSLF